MKPTSESYRHAAAYAISRASTCDPDDRETFRRIAQGYEKMAELLERK